MIDVLGDYNTIQGALDAARFGEVVLVAAGGYSGALTLSEGSREKGVFTLILSAPQSKGVTVHYKVEGSAREGTDYKRFPDQVEFKRGETVVHVDIDPIGDLEGAADKVATLKLVDDPGYTVETKEPEKVKILVKL